MATAIKAIIKQVRMAATEDIRCGYYLPYLLYAVEFDNAYTIGTTYIQKFRATTGGLVSGGNSSDRAQWERTPIHEEGTADVYESGSIPSSEFSIETADKRYVEAGAILTYRYTKVGSSALRLADCRYRRVTRDPNTNAITSSQTISEAVIDKPTLIALIMSNYSGGYVSNPDSMWMSIPVSDVSAAVTYDDIQSGDEIQFKLRPANMPECVLANDNARADEPEIRVSDMVTAMAQYSLGTAFTLNSNTYNDWTSVGNGLEAKGRIIKDADYIYLVYNGWCVFRFEGTAEEGITYDLTAYQSGTTYQSYQWLYYADQIKNYCRNLIEAANQNGGHYNQLRLVVSKGGKISETVWKTIISSYTQGEADIVTDGISYTSLRSMFYQSPEDRIAIRDTSFQYTYSSNYLITSRGTLPNVEVRITDLDAAIAAYGTLEAFTLDTNDYLDWTALNGIEIKGFTRKGFHQYVLINEPEWIEYPELGIKIKAKPADLLECEDMIVPIGTLCSTSYHTWDYYLKTNKTVSGTMDPGGYKALPHENPSTEIAWGINGVGVQTNSINSKKEGILIPTALYTIYASRGNNNFNKLGLTGWKYMRNGVDISENISFDADDFFSEHLYAEEGIIEDTSLSTGAGTGFPSGFERQSGDVLIVDVAIRGTLTRTMTGNINRLDFYGVRLKANSTLNDLFSPGIGYIRISSGENGRIYGGMYYSKTTNGYKQSWYGYTGTPGNGFWRWDFDWQTYLQNHPEVFPTTEGAKELTFRATNGSFGEEIDSLLSGVGTINDGDYFVFGISRPYHYGENYVKGGYRGDDGWTDSTIQLIGTYAGNGSEGDKVLIAPLDGGGGGEGGEDIPTPSDMVTVTFDAETNGGVCDVYQYKRRRGSAIGPLPVATKTAHVMTGWFTQVDGGSEVRYSTIVNNDITVYAQFIEQIDELRFKRFALPYLGSGEAHDILVQSRPITLQPALGSTFRVVARGYFRNENTEKLLGLYVLGSLDYKHWQVLGGKEKRLSDEGFHDIGCEVHRTSMKYIIVILTGQLADGSHFDKIDMTGIGKYNNKLK